jgi:hypothetical protein
VTTEPSAEPILVESRAPAMRRLVPATASRSLRQASEAASSSSSARCAAMATISSSIPLPLPWWSAGPLAILSSSVTEQFTVRIWLLL